MNLMKIPLISGVGVKPRVRSPKVPFSLRYWLRRLQVWEKLDLVAAGGSLPESTMSKEAIVLNLRRGLGLGVYGRGRRHVNCDCFEMK